MRVVDLSYRMTPDMPVYPGTPPPELRKAATLAENGWRESALSFWSHCGTHMDAPAHFLPEGKTLDAYPASAFVGRGAVLDCRPPEGAAELDYTITAARLSGLVKLPEPVDFVLLRTGHGRHWGGPHYVEAWPRLDATAAKLLAAAGLRGVGIDAISFDPVHAKPCAIHHILLSAGLLLLENLANLEQLGDKPFLLCTLPLHYADADGAPARVVAILDE